jgi:CubicO group peptidase (beta-lactamase class C family)
MIKLTTQIILFFLCLANYSVAATVSDQELLSSGQKWDYVSKSSSTIRHLNYREPTKKELQVVNKAQSLFDRTSAKAMALVENNNVVWMGIKKPANKESLLAGYSITKTVTSMGVGKAICSGKLSLDTLAGNIFAEIKGTDLGSATVKDLLMMSSGTLDDASISSILDRKARNELANGHTNLVEVLKDKKFNSAYKNIFGVPRKPGQVFTYRSTDPTVLGIMLNRVTGITYAQWIEQEVLRPSGNASSVVIGQDRFNYGYSAGEVGRIHMTIEDWIRFAIWVKNSELKNDCFGQYVREASKTQINNNAKVQGQFFDGYGYFIWTENKLLSDSYWANGYGGQRIGWNHKNKRMLIVFSNEENFMKDLYWLYREWADIP